MRHPLMERTGQKCYQANIPSPWNEYLCCWRRLMAKVIQPELFFFKLMIITRAQAAAARNFDPGHKNPIETSTTEQPTQAEPPPEPPVHPDYLHAADIRNAGIQLADIRKNIEKILTEISKNYSAVRYEPSSPAYDSLRASTLYFYSCVDTLANALSLFNTANSELSTKSNQLVKLANEVYSALSSAADIFLAASISGTDDCEMGYSHGMAANSRTTNAISAMYSFTSTTINMAIMSLDYASGIGDENSIAKRENSIPADPMACKAHGAIAAAANHAINSLIKSSGNLLGFTHKAFPCSANATATSSYIDVFCKAVASSCTLANRDLAFFNLHQVLRNTAEFKTIPDSHSMASQKAADAYTSSFAIMNKINETALIAAWAANPATTSSQPLENLNTNLISIREFLYSVDTINASITKNIQEHLENQSIKIAFAATQSTRPPVIIDLNLLKVSIEKAASEISVLSLNANTGHGNPSDIHGTQATPHGNKTSTGMPLFASDSHNETMNDSIQDFPEMLPRPQDPSPNNREMSDHQEWINPSRFL